VELFWTWAINQRWSVYFLILWYIEYYIFFFLPFLHPFYTWSKHELNKNLSKKKNKLYNYIILYIWKIKSYIYIYMMYSYKFNIHMILHLYCTFILYAIYLCMSIEKMYFSRVWFTIETSGKAISNSLCGSFVVRFRVENASRNVKWGLKNWKGSRLGYASLYFIGLPILFSRERIPYV